MAELLGAIASGVGIASFAIQLADSVVKLKKFCEDIRDAPEDIKYTLHQLEILTLQLKEVADEEQANPQVFATTASLQQCISLCQQGTDGIDKIVKELEVEMGKKKVWGKLKVVLKKDTLSKLALKLESAKASLMLSYMIYSNGIRRQDTQLIVTEVQKVRISTQQLHIPASASNHNAVSTSVTTTTSASTRLQISQKKHGFASDAGAADAGDDELETVIVSPAARRKCQAKATKTTYRLRFPLWITNRMWELNLSTLQNGWTTRVRTYNTIPYDSPVFELCKHGDFQGVRDLFASGKASPFDVDPDGLTLLFSLNLRNSTALQLCEFLISEGVDPAQSARPWKSSSLITAAEYATKTLLRTDFPKDMEQHLQLIRTLFRDADVDFGATGNYDFFSYWFSTEMVTEIKRHMYDPSFEQLTIKQRLRFAFNQGVGYRPDLLDIFVAKVGVEPASDAVAQALCSEKGIMWREIEGIIRMYATSMTQGDRRATLDLPKFIVAIVSQGVSVHQPELMEVFLENCYECYKVQDTEENPWGGECAMGLVREALKNWLTALTTAGIDLEMFWEARCKLANSDDTEFQFFCWDGERGFNQFCMLIDEYGPLPEDWRVDFSWRLDSRQIPEKAAGDFWEMLDHPERQMAGAWDDSWEDGPFDRHIWNMYGREKPSRHWMKRAMKLSVEGLEHDLEQWDSECGKKHWAGTCEKCEEKNIVPRRRKRVWWDT